MGVRKKRAVTRRQIESKPSQSNRAPVVWKFNSNSPAFGIFIDEGHCWVGNQAGMVYKLNHQGEALNQYQLPEGVKCIVADDIWIYAGCDDGNVYDLSGKIPYLAYEIDENIDIYWLDICDGILGVADANGAVVKIDAESESQWTRLSQGRQGWMIRCDRQGIYHGHSRGVTMYDLSEGRQIWQQKTDGAVLFGWQAGDKVYAGTSSKKIHCFSKTGLEQAIYLCNAAVYSCATSQTGKYVFAGDSSSSLYCFDAQGKRLWKLGTGCGSALSMQYFGEKLYIVTTDGVLACIDASEAAIKAARAGNLPATTTIKAPTAENTVSVASTVATTADSSQGIMVECSKEGNKLRVRVVSAGYNPDWFVQFPRNIRQEGAIYLVEGIREATQGGFYRAYGEIKRLQ
jgi:outer membrane protein assembly factor BamB